MKIKLRQLINDLFPKSLLSIASKKGEVHRGNGLKLPKKIPWQPMRKPLSESRLTLVTTAGVLLKNQPPFDMVDKFGDPTYRRIPSSAPKADLTIIHNYYNHKDADRDLNIVFPIDLLQEFVEEGKIGSLSSSFFGFMGHITEHHVNTLLENSAPEVARILKEEGVDVALLTPG